MALEASDLNDGTILQQTKQVQDARGNIQFNIGLPSGRILKSEFFSKDKAKEALRSWLEVVKQQAVADSNAERLERAAKANRGKMDIERKPGDDKPLFRAGGARVDDTPKPEYPDEVPYTGPVVSVPAALADLDKDKLPLGYASGPHPDAEVDPLEFAIGQRTKYGAKVAELRKAEKKLLKWSIIVEQLEETEE